MKVKRTKKITAFYLLFLVFTALALLIIYKDIDSPYTFYLLIAYAVYLIGILVYFIVATVWKARYLSKSELLKRLGIFIGFFCMFFLVSLVIDLFVKNIPLDFYSLIPIPLGMALGLSFFDLFFQNLKKR